MKTIFTLLTAFLLTVCASAQTTGTLSLASSNLVNGATITNAVNCTALDCVTLPEFYIYPSCQLSNFTAGTTTVVTFIFGASADGTTYTTTRTDWLVNVTLNSTNAGTSVAKVDASGFRYFKLLSIENPSLQTTNGLKNISVAYFTRKP